MPSSAALQVLREKVHISASEIRTYLGCPLQHHYRYIEKRAPERSSIALPFGRAVHTALECFYESLRQRREPESLSVLQELFAEALRLAVNEAEAPILYKKDMPDLEAALALGRAMLAAFAMQVDFAGYEVLAVETPVSAPLISPKGEDLGIELLGVIDLLLVDEKGQLVIVDHKTAKNSFTQEGIDQDLQLGAYAYLLYVSGRVSLQQPVRCRFDVLRKLKTPKFERWHTRRTWADARRFAAVAGQVLRGIEGRICYPARSWLCIDCPYIQACSRWEVSPYPAAAI